MRLCWKGEGQKYYPAENLTSKTNALSLSWWQLDYPSRSRYLLQSKKDVRTILLNIEVKGYTLYAGKEKGFQLR